MKVEYPETMQEFIDRFSTEEDCREYLVEVRWSNRFTCPHCAHTHAWKLARGILKCKKCHRDISATAGNVFAGWHLLKKIRTGMVRVGRERLSGLVEVDEVFLGGVKPGKRGRGALGKVLVLVAVEDKGKKGFGRVRIEIITDASAATLRAAIKKMVEPGSKIRTEEWKGYTPAALEGYEHIVMKKRSREPGEDPTPLVHRIASLLKRWLLGTHHGRVEETHMAAYLDEFVFRFNRRKSGSRGKLFYRLVQGMLHVK